MSFVHICPVTSWGDPNTHLLTQRGPWWQTEARGPYKHSLVNQWGYWSCLQDCEWGILFFFNRSLASSKTIPLPKAHAAWVMIRESWIPGAPAMVCMELSLSKSLFSLAIIIDYITLGHGFVTFKFQELPETLSCVYFLCLNRLFQFGRKIYTSDQSLFTMLTTPHSDHLAFWLSIPTIFKCLGSRLLLTSSSSVPSECQVPKRSSNNAFNESWITRLPLFFHVLSGLTRGRSENNTCNIRGVMQCLDY